MFKSNIKHYLKTYLVINENYLLDSNWEQHITYLLENGVTCCQLRIKTWPAEQTYAIALKVQAICKQAMIPFIINDDIELAKAIQADGVHIGWSDSEYQQARAYLGPDSIIGLSASNQQELDAACKLQPDYLGIGAIYATQSKQDAKIFKDFSALKQCDIPFVFIGGLNATNIQELEKYHPDGFAFVSFLLDNPQNIKLLHKANK